MKAKLSLWLFGPDPDRKEKESFPVTSHPPTDRPKACKLRLVRGWVYDVTGQLHPLLFSSLHQTLERTSVFDVREEKSG